MAEPAALAHDQYDEYYIEKLWSMIPEVYRSEDGLGPQPHVLRQIVEVLGTQAAVTRRSINRLWEDQNIDTCDDWAVPYIGNLVGTRLLPEVDSRARRVDVAQTIRFRRRRGTPSLLEELVRGLSGWDVVLVEAFRRLARTPHRLDNFPVTFGPITRTPNGGTADLRSPRTVNLVSSPFDEFFRTPDVRLLAGKNGRIGLGNFNFHLFRLRPFEMNDVDPVQFTSGSLVTYSIDPSGRDLALFSRGEVPNSSGRRCTSAREWEVARAIPCRLLSDAAFVVSPADAAAAVATLRTQGQIALADQVQEAFATLSGFRFATEARLRRRLLDFELPSFSTSDWYRQLLRDAVTPDSARPRLYDRSVSILPNRALPTSAVLFDAVMGAKLSSLACQPEPSDDGIQLLIDPVLGRFALPGAASPSPLVTRYFYGFSGAVGAGPYTRELPTEPEPSAERATGGGAITLPPNAAAPAVEGTRTIDDNRTYLLDLSRPIQELVLQANDQKRPYVRIDTTGGVPLSISTDSDAPAKLTLDGLWLAADQAGSDVIDIVIERTTPTPHPEFDWDEIRISHATLDPGGLRADGARIPALRIVVRASVRLLHVSRSIIGPIQVVVDTNDLEQSGFVETLEIVDSIVDATQVPAAPNGRQLAISNVSGDVRFEGVTVLGDVTAERVLIADSIVMGRVIAADTQRSCVRFSAALPNAPSEEQNVPKHFNAPLLELFRHHFVSLRFGDPGYAALSSTAPEQLRSGAEGGTEMGAFSSLRRQIRLGSLRAKVEEFKPVGILTQFILEGEVTASASG